MFKSLKLPDAGLIHSFSSTPSLSLLWGIVSLDRLSINFFLSLLIRHATVATEHNSAVMPTDALIIIPSVSFLLQIRKMSTIEIYKWLRKTHSKKRDLWAIMIIDTYNWKYPPSNLILHQYTRTLHQNQNDEALLLHANETCHGLIISILMFGPAFCNRYIEVEFDIWYFQWYVSIRTI